ncbi:hypothetical protein [Streptomyces sp. SPB4]|uniref:hypothetical protein n=1 Tax=Streptomyces sp. SPB4 TaxID=2940553 RepID=UPI0024749E1E|nr:hypothetical protein [Streptomyces sp. SPB4]MDH6543766.1 hypothetical protein [Streptomyces sp. SPB4]
MHQPLVFLESFDSTRATANDREHHPNRAQAQTEALLYLLLGHSLAVNNTYGMDSVSVLELADALLSTRSEALNRGKDRTARARLAQARPVLVSWFGADNLLSACAGQFLRVEPGAKFRLSGWAPIDDDHEARKKLAAVLTRNQGDPRQLPDSPAWLGRDHPELAERFDILLRLAEYSGRRDAGYASGVAQVQLADYLDHFTGLENEAVEELARRRHCPGDIALRIRREISSRRGLVDLGKRGWAHELVANSSSDNLQSHERIREFVDTLYNAVLADSAGAQAGFMSSVPRADARDELKQVNALALETIRSRRGLVPAQPGPQRAEAAIPTVSGVFTAAETLPGLPVSALRQLFTTYWELVADHDRWPSWRDSCVRLNALLEETTRQHNQTVELPDRPPGSSPVTSRLRDAWAGHLAVLQGLLPDTLRADDGTLVLAARHGGTDYAQLLQMEDLAPDVHANALAVGEHLTGLATAVAE